MTIKVSALNRGLTLAWLSIILPFPQSDYYQDIKNYRYGEGVIMTVPDSSEKYVRFLYQGVNVPYSNEKKSCELTFDATLYDVRTDFSQIKKIYEYDTTGEPYRRYTRGNEPYIVPNNPKIDTIQKGIWKESENIIEYARKCYEYVARTFEYKNPNTGLHSLVDIFQAGGSDCGNLSSVYISLLRAAGIPARHVAAVRPDGSLHVWAEFYLERYGWVPVDVTYKLQNPAGDYFGIVAGNNTGIIVNKDINLTVQPQEQGYTLPLLQTFAYWYWYSAGKGDIETKYEVRSVQK
ncbi:MAG: transglutaminase domain-containing protein [Spirochaetota bacterium]